MNKVNLFSDARNARVVKSKRKRSIYAIYKGIKWLYHYAKEAFILYMFIKFITGK